MPWRIGLIPLALCKSYHKRNYFHGFGKRSWPHVPTIWYKESRVSLSTCSLFPCLPDQQQIH